MAFIRQSLLRTAIPPVRPAVRTGSQPNPKRSITTGPNEQKRSGPNWALVSVALGIPLSIYLWKGAKQPSNNTGEYHGANQEYIQNAEGNQGERTAKGQDSSLNSSHDEPRAMGSAKGPTSMSFKQEGLSNADTMNPYVNEPGKSQKGEGETETAKVKGTVKPERPQV